MPLQYRLAIPLKDLVNRLIGCIPFAVCNSIKCIDNRASVVCALLTCIMLVPSINAQAGYAEPTKIQSTSQAPVLLVQHKTDKQYPTAAEKAQIKADIEVMLSAMSTGDVAVFVEKTHPALFPLLGGKENFTVFMTQALTQLDSLGVEILSNDYQNPSQFYQAGDELLSIVPRTSVMQVKGNKAKTIGFMIAIKNTTNNTWKYLDGSGLRQDKSMLWEMFPELDTDIELPENRVEVIE